MGSVTRAPGVLAEVIDGRAVLVNPDGTELFTLNPVGTVVWEAIGDGNDEPGIVRAVVAACEATDIETVTADVAAFLGVLQASQLVRRGDG